MKLNYITTDAELTRTDKYAFCTFLLKICICWLYFYLYFNHSQMMLNKSLKLF